jgi:hypothetical protein
VHGGINLQSGATSIREAIEQDFGEEKDKLQQRVKAPMFEPRPPALEMISGNIGTHCATTGLRGEASW